MGTGLGPETYALIEQGRIGQILSSRPTDRRAVIEEAAGITKFKTKKRLAEARLEEAKLNLNRVNDIFEEVTRQMNSLKRQASKAERYAKLRDEMRAKLRVVLASRFTQMDQEGLALDSQINQLGEEIRSPDRRRAATRNGAHRAHAARVCHRFRDAAEPRPAEPDCDRGRSRPGAPPYERRTLRRTDGAHRVFRSRTGAGRTSSDGARRGARRQSAGCSTRRRQIWPRRSRNSRSASRKRPRAAADLAALEQNQESCRVSPFWKPWVPLPISAIN